MKRTSIAALAIAALAIAGTQAAYADDNSQGKGKTTQQLVELTGTIKALSAPSVTVTVKNASMSDKTRAIAQAILRAGVVTFGTDTNTVIKRGSASTFASLTVGDKVELRAKCTLAPLTCVATRINAAAAPAPKPSPLHLGFSLSGVVTANSGTQLTVVVVHASAGDDNPLKPKAILGTPYNVMTDTSTVVTKAGVASTVSALINFPAVNVSGTCTNATPTVCTAKRITVIVPTA